MMGLPSGMTGAVSSAAATAHSARLAVVEVTEKMGSRGAASAMAPAAGSFVGVGRSG
jgi:hypothetical protein